MPADLDAVVITLKDIPGQVDGRVVMIAASHGHHGTNVDVEAEAVPVQVRPASARLPSGILRIRVDVSSARGRSLRSVTIASRSRVAETVSFFNRLEITQPITINCPAESFDSAVITVSFISRSGDSLAMASFDDYFHGARNECDPVELTIGGKRVAALGGGDYVQSLQKLLGIRVHPGS